jgi:hypothetical protein
VGLGRKPGVAGFAAQYSPLRMMDTPHSLRAKSTPTYGWPAQPRAANGVSCGVSSTQKC